jgi:rhamnosyltransferase
MTSPTTLGQNTPLYPEGKTPSIGVAIITHSAKEHLPHCLPPLLRSPLKPRILVINSSSGDGTVELAEEMGAETLIIPRDTFNHGRTRELARLHLNTDIVVMMTPDAYATDQMMLSRLIAPLLQKKAAVAYARQIPHAGAGFFGSFAREFNYPSESHLRTLQDLSTYGVYTFFCSDSCAAYDNAKLEAVGGFQEVLTGEDTVAAAQLLYAGEAIAYVAEALVHHSHDYSLWGEFKRHFDTGYARQVQEDFFSTRTGDKKRGMEYTKTLLARVLRRKPKLFPYALLQTLIKFSGYQLGRRSKSFPRALKRLLSSQEYYWTQTHE